MSPEPNPEPTTEPTPEKPASESLTLDKVNELISTAIGSLFDSGKAEVSERKSTKKAESDGPSVAEQIKSELERLRASEKEEDSKKAIQSENERLKGLLEGTPIEKNSSKIRTWMWGNE